MKQVILNTVIINDGKFPSVREITVNAPEGFHIDEKHYNESGRIVFIKDPETPKWPESWEELRYINGFVIDNETVESYEVSDVKTGDDSKDIWATEKLADAAIAMAQLSQLRKAYWGDWVPKVNDHILPCIAQHKDGTGIVLSATNIGSHFLMFETNEQCIHFFEHHLELIETATPLLF
jgi:hypothetical protein